MTSNLGRFSSKYHGLGDGRLAIAGSAAEVAAVQKLFLLQFLTILCYTSLTSTGWGAPSVDLTVKLDMLVVLAVFTFVGAVLLGAF
jgi:hypothetical protein